MNYLRDVTSILFGQLAGLLVILGINIVIARFWGPEGKGVYSLFLNTASIMMLLSNLGLSQAAIYFLGRKDFGYQEVTENLLIAGFLLSPVAMGILWVVVPLLSENMFQGTPSTFRWLVVALVPSMIFRLYLSHLFVAKGMFAWYAGINTVDSLVQLCLLTVIALWGADITAALTVCAIVATCVTILSWGYFITKQLESKLRLHLSWPILSRFIPYGVRSYSVGILTRLNLRLDQFLIAFFLDIGTVGIYSVAVALAELTSRIGNSMTMVIFNRSSSQDEGDALVITSRSLRIAISTSVVFAIALALVGYWMIGILFGPQFQSGISALILLLPGTVMMNAERVLQGFFYGRGKPQYSLYSSLLAIVSMLTGNFLLTPRFGINGAAISSTVAYTLSALLLLFLYRRISQESLWRFLWLSHDDYHTVMSIVRRLLLTGHRRFSTDH